MKSTFTTLLLLISLITVTGCGKFGNSSIIHEGVGVDRYALAGLKTGSLKNDLGKEYKLIIHLDYSAELYYEKYGVSFYYLLSKPSQIFALSFNGNYKGKTSKGFVIKKMTVSDMEQLYGPPRWNRLDNEIYAHYDSLGIYFRVSPIAPEPEDFEFYETGDSVILRKIGSYYKSLYKNEKITEITVGLPGSAF